MARSLAQCEQVSSYMDGVHVKIAEAYKPPRKVTLPAAYNNKFSEFTKNIYDFSLEKSVLEKLSEWKNVRSLNNKIRKKRIEDYKKNDNNKSTPSSPLPVDKITALPVKIAPAPETTILTPQPILSPRLRELHNIDINVKTTNGLDYADFDNDTSNPFDNVELKTINDMKELAQVLQPTWQPQNKIENMLNEMSLENSNDEQNEEKINNIETKIDDNVCNLQSIKKFRNASIIVQELQRELAKPYMENWKPWPDLESPDIDADESSKSLSASTSTESECLNSIIELSENDKKLAKHLNDMGFSLSRAKNAISKIGGNDNKKIVEYLLSIQYLEKLDLSYNDAEKSLLVTNYDPYKAKKYYDNLIILKDLGFPEDDASNALVKFNFDRDKALDYLCA